MSEEEEENEPIMVEEQQPPGKKKYPNYKSMPNPVTMVTKTAVSTGKHAVHAAREGANLVVKTAESTGTHIATAVQTTRESAQHMVGISTAKEDAGIEKRESDVVDDNNEQEEEEDYTYPTKKTDPKDPESSHKTAKNKKLHLKAAAKHLANKVSDVGNSVTKKLKRKPSGETGIESTKSTEEANVETPTSSSKLVDTSLVLEPPVLEPPEAVLKDDTIVWIVVASIVLSSTVDHWRDILANQFPVSVVFTWMLVAFCAGQEIDPEFWSDFLETKVLGITKAPEAADVQVPRDIPEEVPAMAAQVRGGFLQKLMRQSTKRSRLPVPFTNLNRGRKRDSQQVSKFTIDRNLMKRLPMFRRKSKSPVPKVPPESSKPASPTSSPTPSKVMGAFDLKDTNADSLVDQVMDPLCELRGMDLFLTDCAEEEMATHPFLLKNGLRDVPTFVVNMMTQWGTVLMYFRMPDWVKDLDESMVEKLDDPDSIKAFKRFLNGDDAYRQARLKILPEIVEANYVVKSMAPKGNRTLHREGLIETIYHKCDVDGPDSCPIVEVTLDMVGNRAIRGMAALVKRYLNSISVDLAVIISKPDGQENNEPEACLGLWRLHHIDISKCLPLPDRFDMEKGASDKNPDLVRASLLSKAAEKQISQLPLSVKA